MKRFLLSCILFNSLFLGGLYAQAIPDRINYQGVLLDAEGMPMLNSKAVLRISMVSEENGKVVYFSEIHQVRTDDQGQFSLVIGEGKSPNGSVSAVPFGKTQISLEVELEDKRTRDFLPLGSDRILAVPYAMHANTASRLEALSEDTEKQQSINWITTGNSLTKPPTHYIGTRDNQDVVIKTNNVERLRITKEGQFKIYGGKKGDAADTLNFPLHVSGGSNGILIEVNGSRSNANNFITFGDDMSHSWGAIQGQTSAELLEYWQYKSQAEQYIFSGASLATRVGAWTAMALANAGELPCGVGGVAPKVIGAVALATELANLLAQSIIWTTKTKEEVGVVYHSGFADYAEWLQRTPGELPMEPGCIVGVKGGLVSRNTENGASHYLVVSKSPILLGNLPEKSREDQYEMISFMGQVKVKVAGPVSKGDFILPSGNSDGFGIAVHPSKMQAGDYARVVGVAWEIADGGSPFQYINTAIGINAPDMSHKAKLLNLEVENILDYLEGKAPLMDQSELETTASTLHLAARQTRMEVLFADSDIDVLLDKYAPFLIKLYDQVGAKIQEQNPDFYNNPFMQAFQADPIGLLKKMRRDPNFITQWAVIDRQLPVPPKK